jgi:alpha-beta hydrolase superfamily lysophospholipase
MTRAAAMAMAIRATETWMLPASEQHPALHLCCQRAPGATRGAALYVHGATFPSALSVFFRFDGRSWADALNDAGFDAWGFDFAGYGESQRYVAMAHGADAAPPLGRADVAQRQLASVVAAMAPTLPLHLIAHSWGCVPAIRCAVDAAPDRLASLTLFGPIVRRGAEPAQTDGDPLPAWRTWTVWEQYRRFIADVPRGEPQVLADRHMEVWGRAYLATDPLAARRDPPAVQVPAGPMADIAQLWSGRALYDASRLRVPTLLVRGAWDSVCDDRDAARLLQDIDRSAAARDCVIARGTHLMHLEASRIELQRAVNEFLLECTSR